MEPLEIQVVTYAPTVFFHCQHCELTFKQMGVGERVHRQQARESLPDDLREQFHELSEWVHSLHERYGDRIRVKVVDAVSIEGVWKSLRHRLRSYPAVIVANKRAAPATDLTSLESMIESLLRTRPPDGKEVDRSSRTKVTEP